MEIRIIKPLDHRTATAELWDDDRLIAEVFARPDGARRLYPSKEAAAWGLEWDAFAQVAPDVGMLLDQADEEMRQTRLELGED
jgi:hypothetical protein